jgi:hypothetical protein
MEGTSAVLVPNFTRGGDVRPARGIGTARFSYRWEPGAEAVPGCGPEEVRPMATWDEVSRACLALAETTEVTSGEGHRQWKVRDKSFAWERPLRKADRAELGDAAPTGPVLAARVPDEGAKQALIAEEPDVYFTTRHFDGFPAVLCRLDELGPAALQELVTEAWACRAPRRLLAEHPLGR